MFRGFIFLFLLLTFFSIKTFSQNYTVSGFITDANSNEILIGAVVSSEDGIKATTTNAYGFYSLTLNQKNSVQIIVSLLGYKSNFIKIKAESQVINLKLKIKSEEIDEVVIQANKHNIVENNETGAIRIPIEKIKTLPNLFGEVDIIKAYQLMPGVQSGGEAKSGMYVRGGSSDQNLILLDEIPLYYVNHFGGIFSVFNADAVKSVKLIKGGFPARYGSRLSSILDVRLKDGNMQEYKIQGTLGLLSSKILIEGPIVKNKSSFIVSARKRALPVFRLLTSGGIRYDFYDTNLKLNHKFSGKNRILFSIYTGNDIIKFKNEVNEEMILIKNEKKTEWGNTLAAVRFNHIFNSKLFSNFTVSYTKYRYLNGIDYYKETDTTFLDEKSDVLSQIVDINTKLSFEHSILPNFSLKYGINSIYHIFIPNESSFARESNYSENIDISFIQFQTKALENSSFVETDFKHRFIGANIGLRVSNYLINNTSFYSFEPRAIINFKVSDNISLKYSYAEMTQYVHLLNYSGVGLPSDFWMPATENAIPEISYQHSVNTSFLFYKKILEFSIEAYYKKMKELIAFKPGESFFNNNKNWEDLIEKNGTGKSYGLEILLQKHKGKFTGWIGATFSNTEWKFENLNNGEAFPYKYDSPVDIGITMQYQLTKRITASATLAYHTGYPVTLAIERYYVEGEEVFVYDEINSFRMSDFHRLDIGLNFKKQKKLGERVWTVSIINVYNRQNPYFYFYFREVDPNSSGEEVKYLPMKLYQKSFFPFTPSFSYSFSF